MICSETIYELASGAGFDLCGIAPYRKLGEHRPRLEKWLAEGRHSGLEYMSRYTDERTDPSFLVQNARTVIVCAVNYKNVAWEKYMDQPSCKVASYAFAPDYHKTVKKMLAEIFSRLQEKYPDMKGRCFTDTAPILEKAWAVEAGLGWIGKNSLLVTPGYGSTVLLGEIIIDHEADKYNTPFDGEHCGKCEKCISACPNSAVSEDRCLDTAKCISRMTIEKGGDAPDSGTSHGWLFGCDICQSCCPFNSRTPYCSNPAFEPVIAPSLCSAAFWESLTEERFNEIFGKTPLKRSGFRDIKSRVK